MARPIFSILVAFLLIIKFHDFAGAEIGVTFSRLADNFPPAQVAPHHDALQALKGQGIQVILGVGDDEVEAVSKSAAPKWVKDNVVPYANQITIIAIAIGHDLIPNSKLAVYVLPALQAMKEALEDHGLTLISVTTPFTLNTLLTHFPPSHSTFDPQKIYLIKPIINFLATHSPLLLCDIYPYEAYLMDSHLVSLDYALLNKTNVEVLDGPFEYTNMLDGLVDAFYSAIEKLEAGTVKIVVSETGWPFSEKIYASAQYARAYASNVFKRGQANTGTPKKPFWALDVFEYNLFFQNDAPLDKKPYALFYPNMSAMY
ncbi:glucan endo-1,3-beta-glucosidase [Jatropha curcas]|uniref:glucan endo-1,3-beta-glucosidase n=1 Tax=Jatropha curcas TaxID=180498 RepID=UPI00189442ED|nr:glucan endo-1,3-beta-glucosidase [Jatropha curcas]